jgi:Glycosyl hydrolases family 16
MEFTERFDRLDPSVWTDGYLPAWSSRDAAAASYSVGSHGLVLSIPDGQQLWCPDDHPTPLRVSGIHSANRSGPVGSHDAQQLFRDGQVVREQQPTLLGFAPHFGTIAVTCMARLTPRSMFSAWMVGLEDRPERCGEICLMEVFGNTVAGGTAAVGQGIHKFRDPALREDFAAEQRVIDVAEPHTYRADWRPGRVTFSIDGTRTRVCDQAPDYPMMLILGLFDFPAQPGGNGVPEFQVTEVVGTGLGAGTSIRGC